MQQEQREEIARFRFGVISDLVGAVRLGAGDMAELIRTKSRKRYNIPYSQRTRISQSTIRRWVRLYENSDRQLSSLYPGGRADQGKSRRVDDETIFALTRLKRQKPGAPLVKLLAEMAEKSLITPGVILCASTAYRILKNEGLSGRTSQPQTDRRRYEAEFPNDIWQSDVMHGPMVDIGGRQHKSYLIAVLDDHSRLLPHAEFFASERLESWLCAFRQALLTRGMPRKLYVDNGAAFSSKHLERICASLGIALVHTPPYTPQGRGKIERFFRSVRTRFLPDFLGGSLEELNIAFALWLRTDYHQRTHSSTGETPFERFARHLEMIRPAPHDLEDHFRKEARRRVAKDRTISLEGRLYEAPTRLIGEYVQLLYHPSRPERVEIVHKNTSYGHLLPVDLKVNCTVRRLRDTEQLVRSGKEVDARPVSGQLRLFADREDNR
ncbi:MAG: DDE-type integrase/transposase/recombinase [Thermodesulfobacteriota bacterium]